MSLIPVGVEFIHATGPYNSADQPLFIAGSDGLDYVAKRPTPNNPCLAATEAIAYALCGWLGVAVPAAAWLEFPDGSAAFGSRWEAGTSQFTQMGIEARQEAIMACREQIARFCLLDAFLANPDRHVDNLLFRRSPLDGRWTVINMDFSRALWRGGFPRTTPVEILRNGHTAATAGLMRALGVFDTTMTGALVAGIQAIAPERIAAAVAEIPAPARRDEALTLPAWWASQARIDRATALLGVIA